MTEEGEHTAAAAAAAQLSSARLFLVVIVVPPFLCFCIIHPSENEMERYEMIMIRYSIPRGTIPHPPHHHPLFAEAWPDEPWLAK